jgi:hypothetical protein
MTVADRRPTLLEDAAVAGAVGAVVGGLPSTVIALLRGRDPLEASLAAGTIALRDETRTGRLLAAAAVTHVILSLAWAVPITHLLPRRRPVMAGAAAGLMIAAVDLALVGRRIPRVRRLPVLPQIADHLAYGAAVGAVAAHRRGHAEAPG